MDKAKLQVYIDEALFRRLRVRAAEIGEPMSALVERAIRKELGEMASRDEFARHLGYASWDDLLAASETVAVEGDVSWYITRLPDGRWAAWDDAEIAADRVMIHVTRETALEDQYAAWLEAHEHDLETDRLRWLAERPGRWVVYYEDPEIADGKQAVWLRREGEPAPDPVDDGADYLLPGAPIRSDEDAIAWARKELRGEIGGARMVP